MKKLLPFLALLFMGASIQMGQQDEIKQYPLQITCPKCGYVFYNCVVPEFFKGEIPINFGDRCFPANEFIKPIAPYVSMICPIDRSTPIFNDPNIDGQEIFTSKGWMPQREKPIKGV